MTDYNVFGIDIAGCHHGYDSNNPKPNGLDKLLFREVLFFKKVLIGGYAWDGAFEKVEGCSIDGLFEKYDKIHLIPYDDYTIYGKKPDTIIISNDNEYYDLIERSDIYFGNVRLCHSICCHVLGFGDTNENERRISKEQMIELINLRDSLLAQNRIDGNFYLSKNCCS